MTRPKKSQADQRLSKAIIFMLADRLGFGDLAATGGPDISSPFADRLAREGVRLTVCTSTHPSLLTDPRCHRERAVSTAPRLSDLTPRGHCLKPSQPLLC